MKRRALSLLGLVMFCQNAASAEWALDAELGWVLSGGNTDTSTLNAKINGKREVGLWGYGGRYETLRTEENEVQTAKKYLIEATAMRKFDEHNFLFGSVLREDDDFSQYDYQATVALGYGRQLLKSDAMLLTAEIGPGFRYSRFEVPVDDEDSEDETILRLASRFEWKFVETASFTQSITVDSGEEQVISKSETALKTQVAGNLAMKASLVIRHNDEPLEGDANTDRETALTLVYSF